MRKKSKMKSTVRTIILLLIGIGGLIVFLPACAEAKTPPANDVWVMPVLKMGRGVFPCRVVVWFDQQFLDSGSAYQQKKVEFSGWKRSDMRRRVVSDLKKMSDKSWSRARTGIDALVQEKKIDQVVRHWIINGFSCRVKNPKALKALTAVPGVGRVFARVDELPVRPAIEKPIFYPAVNAGPFKPDSVDVPWYVKGLAADQVWREFGVFGRKTINVIHDNNFIITPALTATLYRNPDEKPANGIDDDYNGYVDDVHGFNFNTGNACLTPLQDTGGKNAIRRQHGSLCASMVCGAGLGEKRWVPGIAPRGQWAGVIGHGRIEEAVEWAIEIGADTYSMSFSLPKLGEYRSHWRKVMEQGTFCGLIFVSGAGNFARKDNRNYAPVPVQMRVPEDIPEVVISAAGVRRDLTRPPFSSQGPVKWKTDYYREGKLPKPDISTFNFGLPVRMPDNTVRPQGVNGNSFAGAMLSGAAALILSADPELLPWDLRDIIIKTATDLGQPGFDYQTGHGLINCYRAVEEVQRRVKQATWTGKAE